MLFNSIDFALFLPIVFLLYWFVVSKNLKLQNVFLVLVSYFFYGYWDWRFLSLILFSTLVDYWVGGSLQKQENKTRRKLLVATSIVVNLGLLGFFKYYNFFLDNFVEAFRLFGVEFRATTLSIVLPVGISFYTFQTLSYTLDVYKKKIDATTNFIGFAAFVSFFPQLVAGPIERASRLLPQFFLKRSFVYSKAVDGVRQILWGLFKKMVIADNCAEIANHIFNNSDHMNGSTLVFGALFFTLQIYGDFSGYSDIAIGTGRLFGFDLKKNFAFPFFSRDIAEFWRRWHISLSTWFRDYLYIPLGGSRGSTLKTIRNIFIIFIVSGFWHGSNWTFIIWGGLHALYFLPLFILQRNRKNLGPIALEKRVPSLQDALSMGATFSLVAFAFIFFRAENVSHAVSYIAGIFSASLFEMPNFIGLEKTLTIFMLVFIFMLLEWAGRNHEYAIEKNILKWRRPLRYAFYYALVLSIIWFSGKQQDFIYFQF